MRNGRLSMRAFAWLLPLFLLCLAASRVVPPPSKEAPPRAVVTACDRSAGPTLVKLLEAWPQGKPAGGTASGLVRPEPQATVTRFAAMDTPFDGIAVQQWPVDDACGDFTRRFRPETPCATYMLGERRLAVIVHLNNPVEGLKLSSIYRMLAAPEGAEAYKADPTRVPAAEWPRLFGDAAAWEEFGWGIGAKVRVYAENKSSWSGEILSTRCLKRMEWSAGYKRFGRQPLRTDIIECLDADDVAKKVRHDPYGVGFLQYTGQPLKGVKVLAVQDDFPDGWPADYANPGPLLPVSADGTVDVSKWQTAPRMPKTPVALKLGKFLQPEYPLSEPLLLFVHPKAPQNVKDFAKWCVSEEGSAVAETLGLITPRMDAQSRGQERLAALRNGEGTPVGICGDGNLRKMMRQIGVAYTREKRPVIVKYESAKPEDAAKVFVRERYPAMVSFERPRTEMVAKEWAALEAGGLKKSVLGARALAVVVHPSNARRVLTPVELQQIVAGKVRDWRALPSTGPTIAHQDSQGKDHPLRDMSEDRGIHLYLPERNSAGNRLLVERMNVQELVKCERLQSDREILAAVAADPGAIGVINATSLPANVTLGVSSSGGLQSARPKTSPQTSSKGGVSGRKPVDPEMKQGFAVVGIGGAWPAKDQLMAGKYLLAEYLVAYQRGDAPELTQAVLGEGLELAGVQAALASAGVVGR